MMAKVEASRRIAWRDGMMTDQDVADALECDVALVREILDFWACRTLTAASACVERRHGAQACIKLAMAQALHAVAGLALAEAAAVACGSWQVSTSLLRIVEFQPPRNSTIDGTRQDTPGPDPFMLFAPHAAEAIPVAAADEYLDVADGRRVYWRKPRRDAYVLACELHRLSDISRREDTPAFQDEYLELLSRLREPADHVCEWIGTVAGERFRPAPDRFAEQTPAMRQGPGCGEARHTFAESYSSKVSVNVSLAARSMKRRALGLAVKDPLGGTALAPSEGRTRRR
ncbi:hypothetical protein [Mesorhizobium sp. ES1-4]|uniref:hypothetical protein n=1 Tax=Mesorhizobium sp. ES1-4 TaxID=2876627 RepID=UPI001CCA7234|nr:hypothetical protein [Mesorhizobium sp. ES1-4]MBZ9799080.1 hypothetical protein [Mesorhizobium sp. ES1-4]